MKDLQIEGKTAIITGAARNLGRVFAEALACAGAKVCVADIDAAGAQQTAREIAALYGAKTLSYHVDVSDYEQVQALVRYVVSEFGQVDICVANAGIFAEAKAEEMSPETWAKIIAVNQTGAFYTCQAAGQQMISQGGGSIILTTSISAHVCSMAPCCAYSASKGALLALVHDLAKEWGKYNIRINGISPGNMSTDLLTPEWRTKYQQACEDETVMGRLGQPYELAGACVYLASDAASYVTGTDIVIDGGYLAG